MAEGGKSFSSYSSSQPPPGGLLGVFLTGFLVTTLCAPDLAALELQLDLGPFEQMSLLPNTFTRRALFIDTGTY